jgi:hypothetical protein
MAKHRIQQGESIASLAYQRGLWTQTVWDHAENSVLKQARAERNALLPGDEVFLPEKTIKNESGATDQCHRFRRKGIPEHLRIRVIQEAPSDEALGEQASSDTEENTSMAEANATQSPATYEGRANVPYHLDIDGVVTTGTTDDEGFVDCPIPPDARSGRLTIDPGQPDERVLPLQLGHLNPLSELSGVVQRLRNLGFDCDEPTDGNTEALEETLRFFQGRHDLTVTGQADDATRDKLSELHGG